MTGSNNRASCSLRIGATVAVVATLSLALSRPGVSAQSSPSGGIPDISGIWDSTARSHPVNSERVPWGKENFPELN